MYRIDRTTGDIEWKLGGTTTPESLSLVNDPLGGPVFMHDARLLPDGTITIFDNRKEATEPSRVTQYAIDTTAPTPTATLLWEYENADGDRTQFMGSARRQADGSSSRTGCAKTKHRRDREKRSHGCG